MLKNILGFIDWCERKIQYKRRMEEKADVTVELLREHNKRLLRLELDAAMRRNDRAVVHQLYDEYKSLGGNSYMKELYQHYCKGKKIK